MGTLNTTVFARNRNKVNTYIGGVSSFINTPTALASVLGIMEGRISLFSIYGDNIECSINGSYSLTGFSALSGSSDFLKITYYRDPFGLVTDLSGLTFYQSGIMEVFVPKATSISDGAFDMNFPYAIKDRLRNIYAPLCTSIGSSVLNNSVFRTAVVSRLTIYLNPFLATCNAGSPDGDVAALISNGAKVIYVSNFTAPNTITDLTCVNVYETAVEISFTTPYSLNGIDYYEIYLNGVFFKREYTNNFYLSNLQTLKGYSIQIISVDFFYNKSEISDSVVFTTNLVELPFYELNSVYYKLATNSNDSGVNALNGVDTSLTYSGGYAKFTNGFIDVADNDALSFTDGTNDISAHVAFGFIWNSKTGTQFFMSKRNFAAGGAEWDVVSFSGFVRFQFSNPTSLTNAIKIEIPLASITAGVLNTLQFSYDGSKTHTGLKAYLNGVSIGTSSMLGTYTGQVNGVSQLRIGREIYDSSNYLKADMKELAIWKNRTMTPTEITDIDYRIKNNIPLI